MHFAEAAIFLAVASILSTFDISKAKDEEGNVIEPDVDFTGFIRYVDSCVYEAQEVVTDLAGWKATQNRLSVRFSQDQMK